MVSLGAAIFLAMPLSLGSWTGLYLWTSPFLFINTALARQAFVVMNILAVLVLAIALARNRWYCRWLCPTGVLCDTVSKKRKPGIRLNRIPEFNKMLVVAGLAIALLGVPLLNLLDPINIFHAFIDAFRRQPADVIVLKLSGFLLVVTMNFALPHIWCGKLCPLGGLQDMLTSFKRLITKKEIMTSPFLASRRLVLGALTGVGLGLVVRKASGSKSKEYIRPPGALPEEQLKTACLRCGNCGKACPTDIIHYSLDTSDLMGMLTPHMEFDLGYCLPGCIVCGTVCSSGAIKRFTRADKKELKVGVAIIQPEGCLLSKHKECDLCRRYCEYDAVVIRSSSSDISAWPEIITDRCVGCGACMVVCPPSVIEILPV
ncbi:4Fe-4S binding protein [candidate division KSB1 bacterium]